MIELQDACQNGQQPKLSHAGLRVSIAKIECEHHAGADNNSRKRMMTSGPIKNRLAQARTLLAAALGKKNQSGAAQDEHSPRGSGIEYRISQWLILIQFEVVPKSQNFQIVVGVSRAIASRSGGTSITSHFKV
jgi:hypothetical protein